MKTRADIEAMSDEERRIATAELCGWHSVTSHAQLYGGQLFGKREGPFAQGIIPDYLNSLDAMHEAEKVLDIEQRNDWSLELGEIAGTSGDYGFGSNHATARQRNCAFLMVMMK